MRMRAALPVALVAAAVLACGGGPAPVPAVPSAAPVPAGTERLLAMLPQGAQVVVEVDLARLRANPVVGGVVTRALAGLVPPDEPAGTPAAAWLGSVLRGGAGAAAAAPAADAIRPEPPLAVADQVVFAAYGVGTAQAATLTVLAAPRAIADATRIADGVYAVGPPAWVEQAAQRVALATTGAAGFAIHPAPELAALRGHAMPAEAPGASLRVTAQLSFDARIAFARLTGIDAAPAQLSAWGDVVDDAALVIDCDAADPGGASPGKRSDPARRLAATVRAALGVLAEQPQIRALGLPPSLAGARLVAHGSWVRAIVAVGPEHLRRVVERAAALLGAPAPSPPSPAASAPSSGEPSP
jgi:hypothetical protein